MGHSSTNGPFSIAMLVYERVNDQEATRWPNVSFVQVQSADVRGSPVLLEGAYHAAVLVGMC